MGVLRLGRSDDGEFQAIEESVIEVELSGDRSGCFSGRQDRRSDGPPPRGLLCRRSSF